jgi:hypothetical protein
MGANNAEPPARVRARPLIVQSPSATLREYSCWSRQTHFIDFAKVQRLQFLMNFSTPNLLTVSLTANDEEFTLQDLQASSIAKSPACHFSDIFRPAEIRMMHVLRLAVEPPLPPPILS